MAPLSITPNGPSLSILAAVKEFSPGPNLMVKEIWSIHHLIRQVLQMLICFPHFSGKESSVQCMFLMFPVSFFVVPKNCNSNAAPCDINFVHLFDINFIR